MVRIVRQLSIAVVCFTFIFCLSVYARTAGAADSFMNADVIKNNWMKTYGHITSMQVAYEEHVMDSSGQFNDPSKGLVRNMAVERVELFPKYHIRVSKSKNGLADAKDVMEHAFDGFTTREYWPARTLGTIDKGFTGRDVETMNSMSYYLLTDSGTFSLQDGPQAPMLERMFQTYDKRFVKPGLEDIAGESCHVVVMTSSHPNGDGDSVTVWFAHNKGMMVTKFVRMHEKQIVEEIIVDKIAKVDTESGPFWYPEKATRRMVVRGSSITYGFTAKQFAPNVPVTEDSFRFNFPDTTKVIDKIAGVQYVMQGGLPTNVRNSLTGAVIAGKDPLKALDGLASGGSPSQPAATPQAKGSSSPQSTNAPLQSAENVSESKSFWTISIAGGLLLCVVAVVCGIRMRTRRSFK